jgi:hypothetical protein
MPDIDLTCPDCSTVTTLSVFVDESKLVCRKCKKQLQKPGALAAAAAAAAAKNEHAEFTPPAPTRSALRLAKRKRDYIEPAVDAVSVMETIRAKQPHNAEDQDLELRPQVEENRSRVNHALIATLIFVALGGGMGYLRYGGGGVLPPNILEMSIEYSWIVFLVFHAFVVLKAMTDNMLQGILCLLVPGYSLFYLFTISDNFYLRAVLAGLLVGIGQDTAAQLSAHAAVLSGIVKGFIAGGGGDIR